MSQHNFGNLESPLSGSSLVNEHLEPWRDALHSNHSGSTRPTYAVAGMRWINTTTNPWVCNLFDGTDDIIEGYINPTTNVFTSVDALADGTYGDVTVSSSRTIWTIIANAITTSKIANNAVTLAKLATQAANTILVNATGSAAVPTALAISASKLIGRGSSGNVGEISLGTGLSMSGSTLNASTSSPISSSYDSGDQTITLGGALTLAHSLGSKPKIIQLYWVCRTAEHGYSVGDEVIIFVEPFTGRGLSVSPDATNVNVRFGGSGIGISNKSSGAGQTLTPASWRLIVRAYA